MGRAFFPLIISLSLLIASCESSLYPPTYPPVLSDIVLTSTSSKTATDTVYLGDTVFISVTVEDPEEDPATLDISLQSGGGTEILADSVSDSRIFDGTEWETWINTDGIPIGTYTLVLTATDKEGNQGDPVSTDLIITADIQALVTTADIAISAVSHTIKDEIPGEPYTITFSLTNNSAVLMDRVSVPFTVTMNNTATATLEYYTGSGIITTLAAGETKTGYLRLNIQNVDRTFVSETWAEADCTITIY